MYSLTDRKQDATRDFFVFYTPRDLNDVSFYLQIPFPDTNHVVYMTSLSSKRFGSYETIIARMKAGAEDFGVTRTISNVTNGRAETLEIPRRAEVCSSR